MNIQDRYPQSVNTFLQRKPAEFLSIGKAAELLGVSIQTIRRWDRNGKISSIRSPGGHRYFRKHDLEKLFGKKLIDSNKKLSSSDDLKSNLKIITEHTEHKAPKTPISRKRMEKKVRKNKRNRKNGESKKKSFSIKKTFIFLLVFFVSMDFILVLFYFFARNSALQVPYF